MRRFVPPVPRRSSSFVRIFSGIIVAAGIALTTISAQIPSRNVNMVAGTEWPNGDPYLQRQNEPSIGASTRNPLHLLAGSNDYRTVDLPGLAEDETGDAWLGLYKSYDGGQRWTSTLLPGYPQDHSNAGATSPIHGYGAGADAVVRAGTNGLMYFAGLAFDRSNPATPDVPGKSAIFVSRFIDNNNKEAGDTFEYLGTRTMQTDPGGKTGNFLDKPWIVVDIPRDNSRCTIVTAGQNGPITQNLPAGPVYVAYTLRSTDKAGARYDVMFSRSSDCGDTWTKPVQLNDSAERANQGASMAIDPRTGNVFVSWRQFDVSANGTGVDALMAVKYTLGGKKIEKPGFARKFAKPKNGKGKGVDITHFYKKGGINAALEAAQLSPLDQSTSAAQIRFRTNAYPTMTADENGRIYLAWAERGYDPLSPDPVLGAARVLMATSLDGATWTTATPVSSGEVGQKGHQLMPSLTYAGGKLMLIYYDVRQSRAQSFTQYVDDKSSFTKVDPNATGLRHTIDLRASMASPGAAPVFAPSVPVSEYLQGPRTPGGPITPWQVNPPNLPMFQKGTAPFIGDYVDIAAAPNFVLNTTTGKWGYNNVAGSTPPIFHAAWTDNRDVRVPLEDRDGDGNPWNDYVPPGAPGGSPSIFDPTKVVPQCIPGNAGSRNQNIYTARITGGLLVGSPGNTKRLGYRTADNGTPSSVLMERSFVVFAQNTSDTQKRFRFAITNQPVGGRASFDQFSTTPLTSVDAEIPYRSTASRTVYATSADPHAIINVTVQELVLANGVWVVKTGGLGSTIVLNPDIDNPDIDNPDIDNPDIDNPDIDNAEVYNPDIDNPDIDNPDIDNPDIDNPDIDNPDIDNPDIDNIRVANPDIDNPDIDNPDIDNPDIDNPDIDNPDIDNPDIDNGALTTDISWSMTNLGNTTASYNVNLFFAQTTFDADIRTQLILYRTYKTPVVQNCDLKVETRNQLVANIPNPQLVKGSTGTVANANDPAATNATIYLAPGETAKITLRVVDKTPDPTKLVTVTNSDGTTAKITAAFVPNEDVTPVVQQQGVNTEDRDAGVVVPPIVVQFPPPQTVPDSASTAENTAVTINPLANDSTAFGSTKILSFHPAGMAAHSGAFPGPIVYQPSTGFVYSRRGAVDATASTLLARFQPPAGGFDIITQVADGKHGINYGRTGTATSNLVALDARPDSETFHQYLPMPALSDAVLGVAVDAPHNRVYAVHAPPTTTPLTPTTVSALDVVIDDGEVTHNVVGSVALPVGVHPQQIAVNTRTQKVYVAASGSSTVGALPGVNGGVFVIDMTVAVPTAVRISNTTNGAMALAINEAANMVFAYTQLPGNQAGVYAIDGASNSVAVIPVSAPIRFGSVDARLVVHESSGRVLLRLENAVAVIDGQRGSPTRNSVIAMVGVGRENGGTRIAIDQELGLAVTVGSFDFRADVINITTNPPALRNSLPLNAFAQDVTIDPVHHRAYLSVFTYVQEVNLAGAAATLGSKVPVFIESGGILLNPVKNKGYAGLFTDHADIEVMSGAGFEGTIPGFINQGRYLYSEWHTSSQRGFITNQSNNNDGTGDSSEPGSVFVIDGATETVLGSVDVPASPFGLGIDQVDNKVYVASLSTPTSHGGLTVINALDPELPPTQATLTATAPSLNPPVTPAYPAFPLNNTAVFLSFGRHVVANPVSHKVYVLQMNTVSATSIGVYNPVTNALTPLDGIAGSPLFDYAATCQPGCGTWGRASVIRVNSALNRVYVGYLDSNNLGRVVALDGTTHAVVGFWTGGSHSNRHTASFVALNQALGRVYVTDYTNNKVTALDADLVPIPGLVTTLPGGPSATAINPVSNRLYVSSIDSKTIYAIDGATLQVISSVNMPLAAYFMWIDPVESRVYASGGDSADESGAMVITDVLGQLGTNVSVTSITQPAHGVSTLNPNGSITYVPESGYSGGDTFGYNIMAPTGAASGVVNITVVPSAPAAITMPDTFSTGKAQQLNVPAPGVLANDAAGSNPQAVLDQTTPDGVLALQADGSFTYMPGATFTGVDSFTYHVSDDSLGAGNIVRVSISVTEPQSLVVTTIADSGAGSLRQAINAANSEPGSTITFAIPGAGVKVITPASALPTINAPMTIDGYSQPASTPNSSTVGTNAVINVQIAGGGVPAGTVGLSVLGGAAHIRGLSITGFPSTGVLLDTAGGNTIEGNFIGVTPAGAASSNNGGGIESRSVNNLIGGSMPDARNVVAGNNSTGIRVTARVQSGVVVNDGTGTVIKGNLIGTTLDGLGPRANSSGGITVAVPNVTVGGTSVWERNVISGNGGTGISSFATTSGTGATITAVTVYRTPDNLVVQGNYIGIDAAGALALPNTSFGLSLTGANSLVGGSTDATPGACTGACNVISGNSQTGVGLTNNFDNAFAALPAPAGTPQNPTFGTVFSSASGSQVIGNFIGVNAIGDGAVPNGSGGVSINVPNVIVGGSLPGERNVISGNTGVGVSTSNSFTAPSTAQAALVMAGNSATIKGNYIGLSASGLAKITNTGNAINLNTSGNTIGGAAAADGNYIVPANQAAINAVRQTSGTVLINAGTGNTIQRNTVGLNTAGAAMNGGGNTHAITLGTGSNHVLGNTVAGNGSTVAPITSTGGISLTGSFAVGNDIRGNFIGTTSGGATNVRNTGWGISINDATTTTIGGTVVAERNVIAGNNQGGITLTTSGTGSVSGTTITGNYIGILAGGGALSNGVGTQGGVMLTSNGTGTITTTIIGGSTAAERNVISGNVGNGIGLYNSGVSGTIIRGNYIGVASDGTTATGNGAAGVWVSGATINEIGGGNAADGNVIAYNPQVGVGIQSGTRNKILSNRIYSSTGLGIDLAGNGSINSNDPADADTGANNLQNFPVIATLNGTPSATEAQGTLDSTPNTTFTLQLFRSTTCDASGYGEGAELRDTQPVTTAFNGQGFFTLTSANSPGGPYYYTTTATDPNGNTSEFSACNPVPPSTIVTNLSDSGLGSLRHAITSANSLPGTDTISFNISGVTAGSPGVINVASALPVITEAVIIDGSTQPFWDGKPVIEVTGNNSVANGFQTATDIAGVQIKNLAITRFTNAGILLLQAENLAGHTITGNYIGTDRFGIAGKGNGVGINLSTDQALINVNVISGNTGAGVLIHNDADNVLVAFNKIGVMADGVQVRANFGPGVLMYDSLDNDVISDNVIAGNGDWGIDIQDSTPGDVTGTRIRNNRIGLDSNGNVSGNVAGGVRINNAPSTHIGEIGWRNYIGGNAGVGVRVIGNASPLPTIQNNYIGLDPTGQSGRSNNNKGVVLDGPAIVGGTTSGDGNFIAGHSDPAGGTGVFVGVNGGGSAIVGNTIGLNISNAPVPNGYSGITSSATGAVTIGSPGFGRNVISGNGTYGISILQTLGTDPLPANAFIQNNMIGTDGSGTIALGNGQAGINITGTNHLIGGTGLGNTIANNGNQGGIRVFGAASGVAMKLNRIKNNGGLGIDLNGDGVTGNDPADLDSGPNGLQNFPILTAATNPGSSNTDIDLNTSQLNPGNYTVEFFSSVSCDASGNGEGETVELSFSGVQGSVNSIHYILQRAVPVGQFITAVATDSSGNTSEFSACRQVVAAAPPAVITSVSPNPSAPGFGQQLWIRGSNLPGVNPSDVIFNFGGNDSTAQNIWSISPTLVVARFNVGTPVGNATVRVKSPDGSIVSNSFSITVQSTPGAPIMTSLSTSCGAGNITSASAGSVIYVGGEGLDSSLATVVFTPTNPPGAPVNVTPPSSCGTSSIVAHQVTVPAFAPGTVVDVQIKTAVNSVTSPLSNAFSMTVTAPPVAVNGVVRYSNTPLQNISVSLRQGSAQSPPIASTGTGNDGSFNFANVAPGNYYLRADGPDPSFLGFVAATITVGGSNLTRDIWLPKQMNLQTPADNSTGITAKPTLTWAANPDADRYIVRLRRVSDQVMIEVNTAYTNSYEVQTLLTGNVQYAWEVQAMDASNNEVGATLVPFNFTVIPPIVVVVDGKSGGLDNVHYPGTGTQSTLGAVLGNQKVWITATGSVNWFNDPATAPPNGAGFTADSLSLAPGLAAVSLLASINGGAWQFIGSGPTEMFANGSSVQLRLAVNDSDYNDNAGFWTVTIQQ